MTEKQIIDYIKINQSFPNTFDDYFNYGMLIFPLCFIVMGLVLIYNVVQFGNNDLILFAIGLITIGIPFLRFTLIRLNDNLRFVEHNTGLSIEGNLEKSYKILIENLKGTKVTKDGKNSIVYGQIGISGLSWGEKITIICLDNKILINSKPKQPVTICKDRLNIKRIVKGFDEN